ncbi:MAG: hypothetical protein ACWGSQ_15830 [Longimicrobiales bacterium]
MRRALATSEISVRRVSRGRRTRIPAPEPEAPAEENNVLLNRFRELKDL